MSLLAVPVVVDGRVRAVLYGGHRVPTQFGDTTVRDTIKVARTLAWELSVADEVNRRLALLETQWPEQQGPDPLTRERLELRELFAELRELGRAVADPELAHRLEASGIASCRVACRCRCRPRCRRANSTCLLRWHSARGTDRSRRNSRLTEATVKSYISAAMRKLNASNRYEAVIAARRAGLIP